MEDDRNISRVFPSKNHFEEPDLDKKWRAGGLHYSGHIWQTDPRYCTGSSTTDRRRSPTRICDYFAARGNSNIDTRWLYEENRVKLGLPLLKSSKVTIKGFGADVRTMLGEFRASAEIDNRTRQRNRQRNFPNNHPCVRWVDSVCSIVLSVRISHVGLKKNILQ